MAWRPTLAGLALGHASSGHEAKARAILAEPETQSEQPYVASDYVAQVLAALAMVKPPSRRSSGRSKKGCTGSRPFVSTLHSFRCAEILDSTRSSGGSESSEDLTLALGTRLGPYEITAPPGAGDMSEVYRARPEARPRCRDQGAAPAPLAESRVRTRFESEAKTISSLNHLHICTLDDIEAKARPTTWCWRWSGVRRSPIGSRKAPCPSPRRCASGWRSPMRSSGRIAGESCSATWNPGHHVREVRRDAGGVWPRPRGRLRDRGWLADPVREIVMPKELVLLGSALATRDVTSVTSPVPPPRSFSDPCPGRRAPGVSNEPAPSTCAGAVPTLGTRCVHLCPLGADK